MSTLNPFKYSEKLFIEEMVFGASRSSGPGGQHVNKVNTKIELRFNIKETSLISENEKELLYKKIGNKINNRGELIIVSEKYRSQARNKQLVIKRFFEMIILAITPPKKRIPIKISNAKKKKRLEGKRIQSYKKEKRKTPDID